MDEKIDTSLSLVLSLKTAENSSPGYKLIARKPAETPRSEPEYNPNPHCEFYISLFMYLFPDI